MLGETKQKRRATTTFPSCYSLEEVGSCVRVKPAMQHAAPGVVVASRYILDRKLGTGGMGSVWLAYDQSLHGFCALKVLHESQAVDEELRARFRREATVAARIHSDHVVGILEHGEWQGLPYIAMEYVEGEDLDSRLGRVGKLDVFRTQELILQLARGLGRVHARGIVHRDIKPANVLLTAENGDEVAKLVDFGVAKEEAFSPKGGLTHLGSFLGTPEYASPEQLRGRGVDSRSDLWSLAVLAFECLTGSMPFDDDSLAGTCAKILHGPIPSLCATDPSLPPALDAWWYRAMARDPNQRYQSAGEFADGFAEAVGCAPVSAPSCPPRIEATKGFGAPDAKSERRWGSRRLGWWPGLASACLLLVSAVMFHGSGPSTGRVLVADRVSALGTSGLPHAIADTVVLTLEVADGVLRGIQQPVDAEASAPAVAASEVQRGGIQLRCDVLSSQAGVPRRLVGAEVLGRPPE